MRSSELNPLLTHAACLPLTLAASIKAPLGAESLQLGRKTLPRIAYRRDEHPL